MRTVFSLLAVTVFLSACSALPEKPRRRPTADAVASNLTRYEDQMFANEASLLKKYSLKETEFETNCLFAPRDLTQLLGAVFAETAGLKIDTIIHTQDAATNRFHSRIRINGKEFSFYAPADAPRVDMRLLLPQMNDALKLLKPGELLALCRTPYDPETTVVAFGNISNMERAVDEGFPADVPSRRWDWGTAQWTEGLQTEVTLPGSLPTQPALRDAYLKTAQELRARGMHIPALNGNRLFVTDIFESGTSIDLCVDGELCTSPATVEGQVVRCHWDGWGVLLAYTLVSKFGGTPALVSSGSGQKTTVTADAFKAQAEAAFRGGGNVIASN